VEGESRTQDQGTQLQWINAKKALADGSQGKVKRGVKRRIWANSGLNIGNFTNARQHPLLRSGGRERAVSGKAGRGEKKVCFCEGGAISTLLDCHRVLKKEVNQRGKNVLGGEYAQGRGVATEKMVTIG